MLLNWLKGRKAPKTQQFTQKEAALRAVKEAQASLQAKKALWAEEARASKTALESFRDSDQRLDDQMKEAMTVFPNLKREILDLQYNTKYYISQLEEAKQASDEEAEEALAWLASQDLDL